MLHKAWNSKGEMPYCFPRSSIKFQGDTGQNITDFDPNWAFPDYRPVAAFKSLRFALFGSHLTGEPTVSPVLTKWWNWELMLATNFGSLSQTVTKVGSQNFGYQIWFCTRVMISNGIAYINDMYTLHMQSIYLRACYGHDWCQMSLLTQ